MVNCPLHAKVLMRNLHILLPLTHAREELTSLKNKIGYASILHLSLVMGLQEHLSPFEVWRRQHYKEPGFVVVVW